MSRAAKNAVAGLTESRLASYKSRTITSERSFQVPQQIKRLRYVSIETGLSSVTPSPHSKQIKASTEVNPGNVFNAPQCEHRAVEKAMVATPVIRAFITAPASVAGTVRKMRHIHCMRYRLHRRVRKCINNLRNPRLQRPRAGLFRFSGASRCILLLLPVFRLQPAAVRRRHGPQPLGDAFRSARRWM
jgi:hypothetical protein